jgi:methyl-accepting chemotaxis protein
VTQLTWWNKKTSSSHKSSGEADVLREQLATAHAELGRCQYEIDHLVDERRRLIDEARERSTELEEKSLAMSTAAERVLAERDQLSGRVCALADSLVEQFITTLFEAESAVSGAMESVSRIAVDAESAGQYALKIVQLMGRNGVDGFVVEVTTAMETLSQGVESTMRDVSVSAERLDSVVEVSREMARVLDEVDGIAEQTTMLALNASIQAAHAGTAGRGFAVVASEVRKLSERSRKSAIRLRSLTDGVTLQGDRICKELNCASEQCTRQSSDALTIITRILDTMKNAETERYVSLLTLGEQNGRISSDISGIMVALQFHNLLRQRFEHIADPLCALRDSLVESRGLEPLTYSMPLNRSTN